MKVLWAVAILDSGEDPKGGKSSVGRARTRGLGSLSILAATSTSALVAWAGAQLPAAPLLACVGILLTASIAAPHCQVAIALLLSSVAGGPSTLSLAEGFSLSLNGVLNGLVLAGTSMCLAARMREVELSWWRSLAPFLTFAAWAGIRSVGAPDPIEATKDVGLSVVPLSVSLVARLAVSKGWHRLRWIERLLVLSSAIPVLGVAAGMCFGYVHLTPLGPVTPFGRRTLALFLIAVLSLTLAWWRLGSSGQERRWGGLWSIVLLAAIVFSLSRTAIIIAIGLVALSLVQPRRPSQWALVAASSILLFLLLFQVPQFRARFFFDDGGPLDLVNLERLNTQGRDRLWPVVWQHALESPAGGNGTGSARLLVRSISSLEHPHNDYLRVFHDLGFVGILLLVAAWGARLCHHWRSWVSLRISQPRLAKYHMASCLACVSITLSFASDNTLVYSFVMIPVFVIFALADSSSSAFEQRNGCGLTRSA